MKASRDQGPVREQEIGFGVPCGIPSSNGRGAHLERVSAKDLLDFGPSEPITEQGLRVNVNVGVQYLEAWLRGSGAVPIFNLMEERQPK